MTAVAFIGLGTMGLPMAANLVRGGHVVTGFNSSASAHAAAEARGIRFAANLAIAIEGADVVITMLPNGRIVDDVTGGPQGIAALMQPTALYIDMSTIAPAETDAIAARIASRGIAMIDAPVARSSKEAEEGKLLIMAGGSEADLKRAEPLFSLLATPSSTADRSAAAPA